jgi:hypothetical protein
MFHCTEIAGCAGARSAAAAAAAAAPEVNWFGGRPAGKAFYLCMLGGTATTCSCTIMQKQKQRPLDGATWKFADG